MSDLLPLARTPEGLRPDWFGPRDEPWLRSLQETCDRLAGCPIREWRNRSRDPLPVAAPPLKLRVAWRVVLDRQGHQCQPDVGVEGASLRRDLYLTSARLRASGTWDRTEIIRQIADVHGLRPVDVETAFLAGLPAEAPHTFTQGPPSVIDRCNGALARAVLAGCSELDLRVVGNARALVRIVQLRRLLFTVTPGEGGHHLGVSGPLALFRHTTIYGRAMASLAGALPWCHDWTLTARCLVRGAVQEIRMTAGDPLPPGPAPRTWDSRLEERFARDFLKAAPDWDLVREPAPLAAGGHVCFPDFALVRRHPPAQPWYLEIVGFWTNDYLARKLATLDRVADARWIVCVDEERASAAGVQSVLGSLPARVVWFRKRIDPAKVLRILEPHHPACGVDTERQGPGPVGAVTSRPHQPPSALDPRPVPLPQPASSPQPSASTVRVVPLAGRDLYLDWAGRHAVDHPVHARLATLTAGARVTLALEGSRVLVKLPSGPVAALSGPASAAWRDRLPSVAWVRVRRVTERTRADSLTGYRENLLTDRWRVPSLEVALQEASPCGPDGPP